jgi:hypothetical protein
VGVSDAHQVQPHDNPCDRKNDETGCSREMGLKERARGGDTVGAPPQALLDGLEDLFQSEAASA